MTSLAVPSSPPSVQALNRPTPARKSVLLNLRLTFGGLLAAFVILIVGLAGLNSQVNLLLLLVGMSIGVLVFGAVLPTRMVRRIDVERIMPEAVVAGRPFTITYVVRNRRRWFRAWSLVIGEAPPAAAAFPQAFVPVLGPGEQRRIKLVGNCPRRGRLTLRGIRLLSRFPFGMFSCRLDIDTPMEVTVYPTVGRFRRDPWKGTRYARSAGAREARERGSQDEFHGVREYRHGDSHRWIHWRRSARTGDLIVREMIPLRQTQLVVIVDPWPGAFVGKALRQRLKAPPDSTVERVISVAATAVCDGLERGHRVGLICRAAVPIVIAPAAGRAHRQRMLHELASIEPGTGEGLEALVSRVRWSTGWHARCLICAPRPDATHDRVVRSLSGRTEGTLLLTPDSEAFNALFAIGGEKASVRRRTR